MFYPEVSWRLIWFSFSNLYIKFLVINGTSVAVYSWIKYHLLDLIQRESKEPRYCWSAETHRTAVWAKLCFEFRSVHKQYDLMQLPTMVQARFDNLQTYISESKSYNKKKWSNGGLHLYSKVWTQAVGGAFTLLLTLVEAMSFQWYTSSPPLEVG